MKLNFLKIVFTKSLNAVSAIFGGGKKPFYGLKIRHFLTVWGVRGMIQLLFNNFGDEKIGKCGGLEPRISRLLSERPTILATPLNRHGNHSRLVLEH